MARSTRSTGAQSASAVVRNAITASGLSLGELSRRTRVDIATLSRLVNGRATVTLTTFELLAGELGLRVTRTEKKAGK